MVAGAAADPTIRVPPGVPVENPLEIKRSVICIVTGPARVRLRNWPGTLSIANPVVMTRALDSIRSAPTGRKCWLVPLLTVIAPVPNGPAVNDAPGGALELLTIGMIVPAPVKLVPPT